WRAYAATRAAAVPPAATGPRHVSVGGEAASASRRTARPTDTPASDFRLLMAARQPTAASKLAGSAGAETGSNSRAPGHGAAWMLAWPASSANAQDQTSSVM